MATLAASITAEAGFLPAPHGHSLAVCRSAAERASSRAFALVGGVLAVLVTDRSLSLGSLVGFVTLFGITMRSSMAVVILGGLVTSTLLNLLVLPTLAWRYGRFGKQRMVASAA